MRINSDGNLALVKNIGLGGATPSTSGTGITFPATQSASTDANTLDDYEEGTFTPTAFGSGNISSASGRYVKIGKVVYISYNINYGSTADGGAGGFQNLPFTVGSATSSDGCHSIVRTSLGSAFIGRFGSATTRGIFTNYSDVVFTNADFSNKFVYGGGMYEV